MKTSVFAKLAFFACLALMLAGFSAASFADITVTSAAELYALKGQDVMENVTIQAGTYDMTGYTDWEPVALLDEGYSINGNGAVIKGIDCLIVNNKGTVRDITVKLPASFTADEDIGVIADDNLAQGTIERCVVEGPSCFTPTGFHNAGGIAGDNFGLIRECLVKNLDLTWTGQDDIGGIAGYNAGTVEYCSVSGVDITNTAGSTSGYSTFIGFIVGQNEGGTINGCSADNCSASTDKGNAGGIAGYVHDGSQISNCRVIDSDVIKTSGNGFAGGLFGMVEHDGSDTPLTSISSCYIAGKKTVGIQEGPLGPGHYSPQVGGLVGYIQCFQNDVIIRNCYYDTDFTDNITQDVAGYASVGAECMSDSEGKADTYMLSGAFPVDLGTGWRYVAGAYPVYDANGTKTVAISQPEKDNVPLNRNIFRLEVGDLVNNTDIGADAVIPYSDFRLVDVIQDGTDITVDSFTVNGVSIADGAAVFVSDYPETTINFSASVTNHTAAELQAQVNYYRALFGRGRRMFSAESLANLNTPLVAAETALRDNYINITKTEADGYLDDMYAAALVRLLCNITFTAEHGKVMKGGEEVSSVIEEKNTTVTFTAVPDDGYEFVYWVDEYGNILGQDPVLVYSVFYNIGITAVFRDAGKIFTYQDSYGTVYKVQKVTDFSQVDYPFNVGEEGVRSGFKVKEWTNDYPGDLPSSGSVTSDVTFTAVLTRISSDAFTVRYKANPDAEWTTGEFKLGRVFEAEAAASYGGQAFSCWKDGNDNVVSFENRIKISVYSDMDLTACFDGAADSVTIASLQEPVAYSGEGKISFAGQVLEGDDFGSMVYYGVLMLKSSTDPGDLTFDTSNVIVGKAKSRSALTGTFIINKKNVNAGETWYGRAFAVYYDTDNEMKIVYSDTKHATL